MAKKKDYILLVFFIITDLLLFLLLTVILCYPFVVSKTKADFSTIPFQLVAIIIAAITLVVAIIALIIAIKIPKKIMAYQMYTGLMEEYRSYDMLKATDGIKHLYPCKGNYEKYNCNRCKSEVEYPFRKELDSNNNSNTKKSIVLVKRKVSQWYWQLASLYMDKFYGKYCKKNIKRDFTKNDSQILCIIYHLNKATDGYLNKQQSKFTKRLSKFFEFSKKWED